MSNWICDGVPKDGNDYPQAIAGGHTPQENTTTDCIICGLPKEAMEQRKTTVIVSKNGSTTLKKSPWLIPLAVLLVAAAAGVGGWGLMQLFIPKSDTVQAGKSDNQNQNAGTGQTALVSQGAKNPTLFSQGERIFLDPTPDKERGAKAFEKGDWQGAIDAYKNSTTPPANDPEGKIYFNNARARQAGNQRTIAVVVPIANDPNSAKEILRGVARYQDEFNSKGSGSLLEVVIANDGGGLQSTGIADDLIANAQVLAVMGHGIDPFSQQAIERYQSAGLAVLSPLTTSVSKSGSPILKTISIDDKSNELLGSYLDAVGKTLAEYAKKQSPNPKLVLFFNSDSPYSKQLKDSFTKAFSGVGGKLVDAIDTSSGNFDAAAAMDRAKRDGANGVFLALSKDGDRIGQAVSIAKAAGSMMLLGGNELYNPTILIDGGEAINNLVLAVPWSFQPTDPFAKDAIKSWRGRVSWRTATAYDATRVLTDTIAGSSDRAGIKASLDKGAPLKGSTTDFNLFDRVPLVRAVPGSSGPAGSKYQFDPV